MEDSGEFGRVWGKINILQVKILASKPPKCSQRTSKARRICESFERSEKWSQKARGEFFMASKNRKSSEKSERSGICDDVKVKFPLYVFPETMQKIDMLYEADNCKSKTEFIEKAIRFYCGYLLNKDSVAAEYAATQITAITEGIVKGTEQRSGAGNGCTDGPSGGNRPVDSTGTDAGRSSTADYESGG